MYAGELIFFTGLALIKWSILAMYYRIFPTRFMKWGYIVLGTMTGAWWIAVMLVATFQCTPIHRYWDLTTPGTCINAEVLYISTNGVPNIIMDAMILCLPIYEVYKLHVARNVKIAIGANFLVGSIVIVASIIKLKVMVDLYKLGSSADVTCTHSTLRVSITSILTHSRTDYLAPLIIWVEVEPCLGIISACLPTLRPLLTSALRGVGLTSGGGQSNNTPGKPSLVTFGRGNIRQKNSGYTTTRSLDRENDSLEHLGGWPDTQQGSTIASVGVGHRDVELDQFGVKHQPRSIAVRTELAWQESHVSSQNAQNLPNYCHGYP